MNSMRSQTGRARTILLNTLASLLAFVIATAFTSLFWKDAGEWGNLYGGLLGVALILVLLLLFFLNPLRLLGQRYLDVTMGIKAVYPNQHAAFADMKRACRAAKRIDLLLHMGRREFGQKDSLFKEIVADKVKREEPGLAVRILHIDPDSPHVSAERARELGRDHATWNSNIENVMANIREAMGKHPTAKVLPHGEPFIWRLFIFDETVFVSGYIYDTKNDRQAPVFQITPGENSLFAVFTKYFEHLWQKSSLDHEGALVAEATLDPEAADAR